MRYPSPILWTLILALVPPLAAAELDHQWPQWRGPEATGVAPHASPPLEWSETRNVRWKVALPGQGTSTPIVWQQQVFVLAAVPAEGKVEATAEDPGRVGGPQGMTRPAVRQRFRVLAYDRSTGRLNWERTVREQLPHEGHHKDHGFASASPVTDGEVLIAHFGSFGTYALDLAGKVIWEKDLGDMRTRNGFGEGSSPALHQNSVMILWDHEGDDFIVTLDRRDGHELWRQARDEPTGWSTPLVVTHDGRTEIVASASNRSRGYAFDTGEPLWECAGMTANAIPSPIPGGPLVYLTSGFRGSALQAVRLGRRGVLTGTDAVAWSVSKNTPYVPTPLLYQDRLYFFSGNNAILSILDARKGEVLADAERLDGILGVYASPLGAAGRVYLLGRNGVALVLREGPRIEILAQNRLDDGFDASPAAAGKELFLRGRQHLYCIAEP